MKRYLILAASVLIELCLGSVYAWSVFAVPLHEVHGLSMAQTQLIFGIGVASFATTMVLGGRLMDRFGPMLVTMLGGLVYGAGYFLCSRSGGEFWLLLAGYGLLAGMGIGLAYVCPIATCMRWFPRRRGLVTGLTVAGFGGGAILLANVGDALLRAGLDVLQVFFWVAVIYGPVVIIAALMLSLPDDEGSHELIPSYPLSHLLREARYWWLAGGVFASTFAGLLVIGNLKSIGLNSGVLPAIATLAVSGFALGNSAGRVLWGVTVDRIGWMGVPVQLALMLVAVALLRLAAGTSATFLIFATLVGLAFGAAFVIYAALVAEGFGERLVGSVYPFVLLPYAVSGITGPTIGGWLYDLSGSYAPGIITASIVAAIGLVVAWLLGMRLWAKHAN
jgi:OFA family oxalate/formate antiporter-like MFS transporter